MSLASLMIHTATFVTDSGSRSQAGAHNREYIGAGTSFACNIQPVTGPLGLEYMREEIGQVYNLFTLHSVTVTESQRVRITGYDDAFTVVEFVPSLRAGWPNKIVVVRDKA